jgi:gas vesicle protein
MAGTGKFWRGVFIGALVGGALSLFDKPTREAVASNCKRAAKKAADIVTNPKEVAEKVKIKTEQVRQTIEQVSDDLHFIKEKVEEFAEATPEVVNFVKETKDVFFDDKRTYTNAKHGDEDKFTQ